MKNAVISYADMLEIHEQALVESLDTRHQPQQAELAEAKRDEALLRDMWEYDRRSRWPTNPLDA